jgi:hypothetical protein
VKIKFYHLHADTDTRAILSELVIGALMKIFLAVLSVIVFSQGAFASVLCEKRLVDHFQKLEIKPNEQRDTHDYLNPEFEYLGKKAYSKISMEEFQKTIDEAKKFEIKDTRANEAIRVCSSIKAFAKMGLSKKEIWLKTLSFQDGWSEGMREPLDEMIQAELDAAKKLPAEIGLNEKKEIGFCAPSADQNECVTPDGRVYKLVNSVNQLGRHVAKEQEAAPSANAKEIADDLATLNIAK